jgi:alpha-tubulin suppressor-like RCC1 family protein
VLDLSCSTTALHILKNDHTLWACGSGSSGELGDGTFSEKLSPVKIKDDVKSVSAGGSHTLIMLNDNTVWATGFNDNGELANQTATNSNVYVKMLFE